VTKLIRAGLAGAALLLAALACTASPIEVVEPGSGGSSGGSSGGGASGGGAVPNGEVGRVVRVIDGDTIEVEIEGDIVDIRYLGMNTTERGETCYNEGKEANAALVEGQIVTLVPDEDPIDPYDRQLRYIYVGDTFVNAELVRQGWAEAVMYEPNDRHWDDLIALEQEAERAGRGCHGISDMFDDGTYRR